jgi:hypothetical protein
MPKKHCKTNKQISRIITTRRIVLKGSAIVIPGAFSMALTAHSSSPATTKTSKIYKILISHSLLGVGYNLPMDYFFEKAVESICDAYPRLAEKNARSTGIFNHVRMAVYISHVLSREELIKWREQLVTIPLWDIWLPVCDWGLDRRDLLRPAMPQPHKAESDTLLRSFTG